MSVFGQSMGANENRVDHVDVRIVGIWNEKEAINSAAMPSCDRRTTFDDNLIAVQIKWTKIV